jgi:hypothetical protein
VRPPLYSPAGLLLAGLLLGIPSGASAQIASRPFAVWEDGTSPDGERSTRRYRIAAAIPGPEGSTGNHAGTGLLVGTAVGIAAATVFLIQFCDDADTECGADEVGRAVAIFTVPTALAGALVGYLIPRGE